VNSASDPPLASAQNLSIPRCVEGADQAVAIIREHHRRSGEGAFEESSSGLSFVGGRAR
jgi:hypothetical protein